MIPEDEQNRINTALVMGAITPLHKIRELLRENRIIAAYETTIEAEKECEEWRRVLCGKVAQP